MNGPLKVKIKQLCIKSSAHLILFSLDLLEDVVEFGDELVGIVDAEAHRRLELEDVVVRTLAAHDDLLLLHPVDDVLGLGRSRSAALAVQYELDPDEEASSPHVTDDGPPLGQLVQLGQQVVADLEGVLLEVLPLHDLHHGVGHGARHRVATVL